jgi:PTS system glucose-specific IIA component
MDKNKDKKLLAVANGRSISLDLVEDEVFASRMLGEGVAVEPASGVFFSPADGVLENVSDTKHAYSIKTNDGLEILVHIGIDTVELGGEGFTPCVKKGDRIKAGDVLARADVEFIKSKGYSTVTPVIISNWDSLESYDLYCGDVVGGETPIIGYR